MSHANEITVGNQTGIIKAAKEVESEDTAITPVTLQTAIVIVTSQVEEDHVIATIQEIEETEETTPLVKTGTKTETERNRIKKAVTAGGKFIYVLIFEGNRALKTHIRSQSTEKDQIQTRRKKRCGNCTPISKRGSWHRLKPSQTSMSMAMNFSGMVSNG